MPSPDPSWVYHYGVDRLRNIASDYDAYCPGEQVSLESLEFKVDFDNALKRLSSSDIKCVFRDGVFDDDRRKVLLKMARMLNKR